MTKSRTKPIDKILGRKLRLKRISVGFSQQKLAKQLDITFQQIQKYENGINRISVSRLIQISKVLKISTIEFLSGLENTNIVENMPFDKHLLSISRALKNFSFEKRKFLVKSFINLINSIKENKNV